MALLLGTVCTQDQTVDQLIQNFDDLVNNIQGTTHTYTFTDVDFLIIFNGWNRTSIESYTFPENPPTINISELLLGCITFLSETFNSSQLIKELQKNNENLENITNFFILNKLFDKYKNMPKKIYNGAGNNTESDADIAIILAGKSEKASFLTTK